MRRITVAGVLAIAASIFVFSDLASMQGRRREVQLVNGREAVAREILVKFRNPAVAAAPADAVGDADVEAIERIGGTGIVRLRSRSLNAAALVAQFAARPDVLYAEPNYIVHALSTPNDPSFPQLWGLENVGQMINGILGRAGSDIRAVPAWDITVGSAAHVVAVIDTGIDYTHPDLAANMWSAPAPFTVDLGGGIVVTCAAGTHGFNAIARTCDPMDDHYHGTHVAGTIGAVGNNGIGVVGVNWTTRIMAIKFLDETGSGSIADAISSIRFAVAVKRAFPAEADVRVLSNSWGDLEFSQALLDEIAATVDEEMLFVAAAGNYGLSNDSMPMYPASYDVPTVVSVAATTNTNELAYFSNYGPTTVHLGAPGADILSHDAREHVWVCQRHFHGRAARVRRGCARAVTVQARHGRIEGRADWLGTVDGCARDDHDDGRTARCKQRHPYLHRPAAADPRTSWRVLVMGAFYCLGIHRSAPPPTR